MTAGHRHRHLRLQPSRPLHRALLAALHLRLHTADADHAERSRWVYGPIPRDAGPNARRWQLTVLGALHTLTGLTVELPSHQPPPEQPPEDSVRCPYGCPWWCITGAGATADLAMLREHMFTDHRQDHP